ncbi:NYN domain-containing protein [Candidatus Parcubacteria bacterium]|nr:NYN domain-containing protein [Candidatus Parcubacteria bacterium]
MFKPKTRRIELITKLKKEKKAIIQLEGLLQGDVNMYVDYANVRPWANKLDWNIEPKRLWQFLRSFDNVGSIKLYDGTLVGDGKSEEKSGKMKNVFKNGFITKPVKILKHSINYTSIKPSSTDLLEQFIRRCLIRKYEVDTIEKLNSKFKEMNQKGEYYIEDRKCNFDVEIGRDMLLDFERNNIDTFVLWSGDSDFYDPVKQLLGDGKNVILFATARKIAKELNELIPEGLFVFDLQKIRNFICWKKQIQDKVTTFLNAKETPQRASKL